MTKILLDTNFLLAPILFRVDVFEQAQRLLKGEAEFVIISPVEEELHVIAKGRTKESRAAKAMIDFLKKKKFETLKVEGTADAALLQTAKKTGAIVATGDQVLRRRLKAASVKVFVLKDNRSLTWG